MFVAPVSLAVAAAAAPFGVDHARASKLRSRLRALVVLAVAAAAAPFGVDHARASKLRSRLRAL
jgi:lipopolysaccharide export LptBFGC system permease protein LptF